MVASNVWTSRGTSAVVTVVCCLLLLQQKVAAFVVPTALHATSLPSYPSSSALAAVDLNVVSSAPSLMLGGEVESWRQYVPLIVSLLVITDILLGSPAANAVLSIARPPEDQAEGGLGDLLGNSAPPTKDLKERVDTMAMAQQALDKAAATTELRKFLDESKSDMEKMRDVQKKLDAELAAFDQKQLEKEEEGMQ